MKLSGIIPSHRRDFLKTASVSAASLAVGPLAASDTDGPANDPDPTTDGGYMYRVAFGCWINDMRSEAPPLQQWPAPRLDS